MPFNLGLPEVLVLLALALVIFGPKRLPELGKSLGEALMNFKSSFFEKNATTPSTEDHDQGANS